MTALDVALDVVQPACTVCGGPLLAVDGLTLRQLTCQPCRAAHSRPLRLPAESWRARAVRVGRLAELDALLESVEDANVSEGGWQLALPLLVTWARRLGVALGDRLTGAELHEAVLAEQAAWLHDVGDRDREDGQPRARSGRFTGRREC